AVAGGDDRGGRAGGRVPHPLRHARGARRGRRRGRHGRDAARRVRPRGAAAAAAHARGARFPGTVGGMTRLTVPDADERGDLGAFVARVVRLDQAALVRLRAGEGTVTAWAATP